MQMRFPQWSLFGNDDWHSKLLHISEIAKQDTESKELVLILEKLEEFLATVDECDRTLSISCEYPYNITQEELGKQLDCEHVAYRFLDENVVEVTVKARGSKSHLVGLAKFALERSIRFSSRKPPRPLCIRVQTNKPPEMGA